LHYHEKGKQQDIENTSCYEPYEGGSIHCIGFSVLEIEIEIEIERKEYFNFSLSLSLSLSFPILFKKSCFEQNIKQA
jgi:hypothetical protein